MVSSVIFRRKNDEIDEKDNKHIYIISCKESDKYDDKIKSCYNYDEALNLTGNGKYNVSLFLALSLLQIAMGLDMFGFSVVAAGCSCDFNLSLTERGILTSMPFIGVLLMAYPWGYYSDTKGRKKALVLATIVSFIMAIFSSMAPNWKVLAVIKLIGTSFSSAIQSATYVLLGECCIPRLRNIYMLLMTTVLMLNSSLFFSIGYLILNLEFRYDLGFLDLEFTPWRLLTLVLALPLGFSFIVLMFFYESPKFLANQGKNDEALEILTKIYRRNGGNVLQFPVKQLILTEEGNIASEDHNFFQSIWIHTAPLFKPPLLLKTLQLYFLTAVVYATNNSFLVWFPFIVDEFFKSYDTNTGGKSGLCPLLIGTIDNTIELNTTAIDDLKSTCSGSLELQTVLSAIIHSTSFVILNVIISKFSNRKKIITLLTLGLSTIGGIGCNLAPEPISSLAMFLVFMVTAMCMGIIPTYFVDLYPTSYRGMVTCLGVMVARLSSLAGINLVGYVIMDHCVITFYSWSAFVLCGVIIASFLPSDRSKKTS